jgi:hypothetical protein
MIATRSDKSASTMTRMYAGRCAMKRRRDDKPSTDSSVESEGGLKAERDRRTSPVSTRVGRNSVDIDVPALRQLVDTVKDKLKP